MKYLISAALALVVSASVVMAADISPVYQKLEGNQRGVFWEQLNNDDTAVEANWTGGCGMIEATGTQATADFELQWGSVTTVVQDVDSTIIPTGVRFTSVSGLGMGWFDLPTGKVDIKFSSAGTGTQDVDVRLIPLAECK